jgi:glucose-1-phosphate thymidylyltransferase
MVSQAVLFAPADRLECRDGSPHPLRTPSPRLALLPVGNRPLILHALDELKAAGIEDVAVVSEEAVAEQVEQVVDSWADRSHTTVTHAAIDDTCGFIDALQQVESQLGDGPFVVHLCDSLRHGGFAGALTPPPARDQDVIALVEALASEVTPVRAGLASLRSAGVYVFGRGVLALTDEGDKSTRWDTQIAAATERLADAGGRVEIRAASDCWRYHQRPDILLQANRFFLEGLSAGPTEAWLENTDLQGPVVIDPSARLRSTTVRGPVIIGPDVEISDAYIGPYTSIGRGVVIENAEVEHSIILPGASIRHLGGRLEASVVGSGARIFRDFRLPRALRLNVGEGAEVALT